MKYSCCHHQNLLHFILELAIEIDALYLASGDRRVPWYAKLWLMIVIGYTLSPIDLIPDFIPIIGYLDDLLLLPIGLAIAIRLVPPAVMADCRQQAKTQSLTKKPKNWVAGSLIIAVWMVLGLAIALKVFR